MAESQNIEYKESLREEEQPDISQEALGESIGVTRRVVQKYINALKEAGRIERVGGKRYGHWEIRG